MHQRRQTANLTFGLSLHMDIATVHRRDLRGAAPPTTSRAAWVCVSQGQQPPPTLLINPLNLYAGKQRIPGSAIPGEDLLVIMLKHMHVKVRLQQRL